MRRIWKVLVIYQIRQLYYACCEKPNRLYYFFSDSDPHKCKNYRQIYNFLHSSLMKFFFAISKIMLKFIKLSTIIRAWGEKKIFTKKNRNCYSFFRTLFTFFLEKNDSVLWKKYQTFLLLLVYSNNILKVLRYTMSAVLSSRSNKLRKEIVTSVEAQT